MTGRSAAAALCLLLAAAVRLPASDQLPLAVAGALAAPLAALLAGELAGARAAAWAGGLVALSPIHTLASRKADPDVLLVLCLLLALWLWAALDREDRRVLAVSLGLALGGLAVSGVAAFVASAILLPSWMASRPDRRRAAALSAGVALAVVAAAAALGLLRSPIDYRDLGPWIAPTTAEALLRCTGASFTRVIGIEYQLAVAQARYLLPLSALFVALMLLGAVRMPARWRGLLVTGALVPFALGAVLAVVTGHVLPLQAARLVASLPFVALLMGVGLASLRGARAWAAGSVVSFSLVAFLALALAR